MVNENWQQQCLATTQFCGRGKFLWNHMHLHREDVKSYSIHSSLASVSHEIKFQILEYVYQVIGNIYIVLPLLSSKRNLFLMHEWQLFGESIIIKLQECLAKLWIRFIEFMLLY